MTNAELAAICTCITAGLGAIGAVVRTGLAAITNTMKESRDAMLKFVAAAARLEVKLDHAAAASAATKDAVHEIFDEVSGVHDSPPAEPKKKPPKRRTPVHGVGVIERSRTQPGDDDR